VSFELDRSAPFYVAGHHGLAGSAVWRALDAQGFTNLIGRRSAELDLRDREATFAFFAQERPEVVVLAAARVGGILANSTYPAEFLSDNLRIQVNVLDAAREYGVRRLLFLGSSCIYPKFAEQPIREDALLTGPLEPTNDAYAIAKIAGVLHVQALRREYGLPYISAMPTNLYGPNDNFDLTNSHVLPALIRRFDDARATGAGSVTIWGTGRPRREFMHVDDLARACLFLLENYDEPEPINVGTGIDVTIGELAALVARVVGFDGRIEHDPSKPDGTPQKLLDVSKINALGWKAQIALADGLASTYDWYRQLNARTAAGAPRQDGGSARAGR
jgi:GDP-L-fucose synthase